MKIELTEKKLQTIVYALDLFAQEIESQENTAAESSFPIIQKPCGNDSHGKDILKKRKIR